MVDAALADPATRATTDLIAAWVRQQAEAAQVLLPRVHQLVLG
jgi:hypothetical protein